MKRFVILFMLLGITVPFVLMTDLYPFYRFGMFAEAVERPIQTETFALRYVDQQGQRHWVKPEAVGLASLAYLLRNYYYRHQTTQLLRNIHQIYPQKNQVAEWQLLRITSPTESYQPDTVLAGQWKSQP